MKSEYLIRRIRAKVPAKVAFVVLVIVAIPVIVWAQWTTSSNDIYSSNSANVGIGTSSPGGSFLDGSGNHVTAKLLDIQPGTSSPGGIVVGSTGRAGSGTTRRQGYFLRRHDGWSTSRSGLWKGSDSTGMEYWEHLIINNDGGAPVIIFAQNNSERMRLDASGNVGIGTTSPSTALHVVGDVTVSGNISAKYQDLAEWVPATKRIAPGTVVIQDSNGINTVIASTESYDTRVAGVVSATPGIILGEAGEGKVKVATTGRVKVRVDATQAPVRAGDLLVTSGKEGVAMRSEPLDLAGVKIHRPGTLIGKALEPLNEGEGEILVLLSLQ